MRLSVPLFALLLLVPITASAQELESLADVRLTFDRSGTRSLGMGSTALASKDASVAATNPAAIAGAPRSFSIETGRTTIEGRYVADTSLNTIGIESTTNGIRSASLTLPMAGVTWSFFYDQPLNIRHSTASLFDAPANAAFFVCDGHLSASPCESPMMFFNLPATYPLDIDLRLQRYGAAAAWSGGPLAVGASLRRENLRQHSAFPEAMPFIHAGLAETIDDVAYTWAAGATYSVGSRARIGAAYSSGASFAGERTFLVDSPDPIQFRTPPSHGIGVSVDLLPQLTLAADAVRIRYSAMFHDQRSVHPLDSDLGYPDVTELHAGAEYRLGKYALRAGWWRDPSHALRTFNGVTPPPPMHYVHALDHSSEDHVTAGISVGEKTRFDAAIDRGPRSTRVAFGVSTTF